MREKHTEMCNCFIVALLLLCSTVMLSGCRNENIIEIVKRESFYLNFTVEGNKVYIECELSVNNVAGKEVEVEFYAYFPDDVNSGLLKNERLKGYQKDKKTSKFFIPEGNKSIVIVFVGDFAGINKKHDRALPKITIVNQR